MSWHGRLQPRHCRHLLPLLLSISVVSFLVLFSLSSVHHSHRRHPLQFPKFTDFNNVDRRRVDEVGGGGGGNSTMVLAKERTHRKDPTDDFKRYNGGWNITDTHYWTSAAYSGLPFVILAAVWFVVFGLTLVFVCLCYCCYFCCPSFSYSPTCYTVTLVLFSLCTAASVAGCVSLYFGQEKFYSSTKNTLDYVVAQADGTAKNLTSVSTFLDSAKNLGVHGLTLPPDMQDSIGEISKQIASAAMVIKQQTHDNYNQIMHVIDIVRKVLIELASVLIFLVLLGSVLSFCGCRCLVYFLVILGWLLVTATLLLSGVFLVLHNVVSDTCIAMDEWVSNPAQHTTLDEILPCINKDEAQAILQKSKFINLNMISFLDTILSNVSNGDIPKEVPGVYYNQSGPLLPLLCVPYNSNDLSDRSCDPGEVDYSNATQVWEKYVCKVGSDGSTCITTGRLNPTYFDQANSVKNISYSLYAYTPFLVQLADCTFVHNTFRDIIRFYCPDVRKYTKWIYGALTLVSFGVMLTLICWGVYAQEGTSRRVHSKDMTK